MNAPDAPHHAVTDYDAEAAAEHLWHDLWNRIESDVPTFAVVPYPPYAEVKEFEARIREGLQRAFAAGAGSSGE